MERKKECPAHEKTKPPKATYKSGYSQMYADYIAYVMSNGELPPPDMVVGDKTMSEWKKDKDAARWLSEETKRNVIMVRACAQHRRKGCSCRYSTAKTYSDWHRVITTLKNAREES